MEVCPVDEDRKFGSRAHVCKREGRSQAMTPATDKSSLLYEAVSKRMKNAIFGILENLNFEK